MSSMTALSMQLLADTETPVSAYLKLCTGQPDSFLLESSEMHQKVGRYSVAGWDPVGVLELGANGCRLTGPGVDRQHEPDMFYPLLQEALDVFRVKDCPELPGVGSLVGYIGWDAVRLIEKLPAEWYQQAPVARLILPSRLAIFDHLARRLSLVALGPDRETCQRKLDEAVAALKQPLPQVAGGQTYCLTPPAKEPFMAAVTQAKEYIKAGDIFQVVLSSPFVGTSDLNPLDVYRWLRVKSPSPYMFYLSFGDHKLVGASPETMARVEDRRVFVRPIAGTRGRSADPAEDRRLEAEMLASEKERAEHVMLVDLARNDVGRVAQYGSVKVDPYMSVERYSHVMHITSQVEGLLRKELDAVDAFCAAFPAGTLSGAPKVRAMEIIDELEPGARGVYGGAVGLFGPGRQMDTCIAIRFLQFLGDRLTVQVGAGIVADSDPEMEYQEINHKAGQSLAALEAAARGELS